MKLFRKASFRRKGLFAYEADAEKINPFSGLKRVKKSTKKRKKSFLFLQKRAMLILIR